MPPKSTTTQNDTTKTTDVQQDTTGAAAITGTESAADSTTSTGTAANADPVIGDGQADTTATDGKAQEELEAENAANQTAPADAVIADTHIEDGSAVVQPVDPVDEYDQVEPVQPSTPEQQAAEQHAEVIALDHAVAEQERVAEIHTQDVDGVAIANTDHDQAKELYASLLAADLSEESKATLRELGGLLDLNTQASAKADSTGDYAAGDIHA